MNRIPREDAPPRLRRGRGLAGGDDALDLFSRTRHIHKIGSDRESNGENDACRSEGGLVGSAKLGRSAMDDLLSSEIGKHDYDWLLTPPGTPLFSEATEHQVPLASTRSSSKVRSVSVAKASRLSVSQTENGNGHSTRPSRSTSVLRPSISTTHSSSYFSNNSRTSVLNTSTASVTSRPSTPGSRSTTLSSRTQPPSSRPISSRPSTPASHPVPSRPSTPASRTVPSRSSTPAKTRPSTSSGGSTARPAHIARPATPTGRPHLPANTNSVSNSLPIRSASRPSTPTCRTPAPSSTPAPAPVTTRSPSVGRASTTSSKASGPASRPSSPGPRTRAPVLPIIPPDFPLDAPPNLRTKLPERAVSAGRMRPGMALTSRVNSNSETATPVSSNRRHSSPAVTRGRYPENTSKARVQGSGNDPTPEVHKNVASDAAMRKPARAVSLTESTGFGRTISKKSLDMALRHMDIRQNVGSIRGASIFPQSIRSSKGRSVRMSDSTIPTTGNGITVIENGNGAPSEDSNPSVSENGDSMVKSPDGDSLSAMRTSELDIYGSYRYDSILLKEDSKNMNWLHSIDNQSDQGPEFDHRFEPLPEPFGIL